MGKLLILTVVISLSLAEPEYIDLTHDLDSTAVFWPGGPSFKLNSLFKGQMPGGFWLAYNEFSTGEHGGTHMDAPAHFSENNWYMSDIPLNRFIGPGVVIDISARAAQNPDAQLTVADLEEWESNYGKIPSNAFVLLNSGWTKRWPDKVQFFGSSDVENSTTFHFPSISEEAAQWLYANRPYISAVGLDTASIDPGPSHLWPAHRALLPHRIIGLENVANLEKVPPTGAIIHAVPIKVKGGTGGPMRIFATLHSNGSTAFESVKLPWLLILTVLFVFTPFVK